VLIIVYIYLFNKNINYKNGKQPANHKIPVNQWDVINHPEFIKNKHEWKVYHNKTHKEKQ
jgi:hypothetical protein